MSITPLSLPSLSMPFLTTRQSLPEPHDNKEGGKQSRIFTATLHGKGVPCVSI